MKVQKLGNTRIFELSDEATVIEQQPGYRTFRVRSMRGNAVGKYHLYFPYMIFVISNKIRTFYDNKKEAVKTIHFGLRTSPLRPSGKFLNQKILFPPLANIYCKWMLCCSPERPTVEDFWAGDFNNHCSWLGEILLKQTFGSREAWQDMSPIQVMEVFKQWPNSIRGCAITNGITFQERETGPLFSLRWPLSKLLRDVDYANAVHAGRVRTADEIS